MANVINDERASAPAPPDDAVARSLRGPLGKQMKPIRDSSAIDIVQERFRDDHVRAFFAWIAFMTLHPLDEPQSGIMAFSLAAGRQRFSWILPEGGAIHLPLALARDIEEHGGELLTSKRITRIAVEGGRAQAVEPCGCTTPE